VNIDDGMSKTNLRQLWSHGKTALGAWCFHPDALTAEVVSKVGFDYACLDMQHGLIDYDTALAMIRGIDLGTAVPIVRVWWNDPAIIGRVLDAGAMGIIVPMVNSAADARLAVSAARFAPDGERSYGPIRAEVRDGDRYFANANDAIAVIPMIETAAALDAVDDIVAVDGVDAVYVGVYDLSIALGLSPGNNDGNAIFDDALQRVLTACQNAGVVAGCHSNPDAAALRLRQGFRMVTASADLLALQGGLRAHLAGASAALENKGG